MQCSAGRCVHSGGDEEGGIRTSQLRLSAHPGDARPTGDRHDPKEASASLSREDADGAQAWRPKKALGTRRPLALPSRPGERLSRDFVSDAFTDGRRFRILAVVDDFTRECLCLVADTSLSGVRLVRELDSLIARRGKPRTILSDNGTEMTSMAILKWCQETKVDWHYKHPRQANAKRLRRKLQRQLPRQVPQRDSVFVARSSPRRNHGMGGGLQQEQASLVAGQHHTQRIRNENGYGKMGRVRPD